MTCSSFRSGECCRTGFRHGMILLTRTATDANGAHHLASPFERHAARKDHHATVVRGMDPEELATGLRDLGQIFRGDVEGPRGKGLFDGNINAAHPGVVHAHVSDQIAAGIRHGDVHRTFDLLRLALCGRYDFSRIFKRNHLRLLQWTAELDFSYLRSRVESAVSGCRRWRCQLPAASCRAIFRFTNSQSMRWPRNAAM